MTHMKQTNSRTTTESLVYSQAAAEVHAIAGNFIILEVTEIRGRVGPLKATLDARTGSGSGWRRSGSAHRTSYRVSMCLPFWVGYFLVISLFFLADGRSTVISSLFNGFPAAVRDSSDGFMGRENLSSANPSISK